jgi:hypothetical protein
LVESVRETVIAMFHSTLPSDNRYVYWIPSSDKVFVKREKKEEKSLILVISGIGFNEQSD